MKNESFERAKILKEEIEKCNSLLELILKSSICNRLLLNILQVISQKYGLNL